MAFSFPFSETRRGGGSKKLGPTLVPGTRFMDLAAALNDEAAGMRGPKMNELKRADEVGSNMYTRPFADDILENKSITVNICACFSTFSLPKRVTG